MFGLVNTNLNTIKPNYDAMSKGGTMNDDGSSKSKITLFKFILKYIYQKYIIEIKFKIIIPLMIPLKHGTY